MLPASPKKQLTSIEPLKRLYVDQPLNANAESFPQEIKACGTLKGTQRWGSSAWVSRARLLLFRLRLSAAVAVTGPSATVAGAGATVGGAVATVAGAGAAVIVVSAVSALPVRVAAAVTGPSAMVAGAVATVVAAVTDPSATVAAMGAMGTEATVAAMGTAAAVRTTGMATEVMFCRTCLDIMDRVTRTQPTPRGITIIG